MSRAVITGRPRVVVIGVLSGIVGAIVAGAKNPLPLYGRELAPAPWRVAKVQGGTALRLAMVHDVLHERYLRHGEAWYAARNLQAQKVIETGSDEAVWEAMDDLAVGLERTGHGEQAAEVMRKKLSILPPLSTRPPATAEPLDSDGEGRQMADMRPLSTVERHHYTAHANLGTSLIHRSMRPALQGDAAAGEMLREGMGHIQEAIAINPVAHFGRERWQAIAVQHLLAAIAQPWLWTKFDLCGNDLDTVEIKARTSRVPPGYAALELRGVDLDGPMDANWRQSYRAGIPRLGSAEPWQKAVGNVYVRPVPFDEPALGLIGMWTMGGGPNPISAMTLGRIMEGIGQPYIAFTAYERALEMKDRIGPTPEIQRELAAYCRQRQESLARIAASGEIESWMREVRATFQKELAWGKSYQDEYHAYEARKLAAGASLDDARFYDDFFKGRAPIASDPGLADDMYVHDENAKTWRDFLPLVSLGTGLGLLVGIAFPERRASK